ncbi:MAG TPA: ATP-binding protein [Caldimonas sp.]|nr:ATP-binding protein [Caldimonas sp.]HEX2540158.1 ATP-binding protein [Caldimonas sp.]
MSKSSPTVRRWLVALVAAAVLPTLIAALAALLYAYKEEKQSLQARLQDTTRALALVVDREIARREAIVLTLAGSPTLTHGDLEAFHEYARQIAPTRDKVVVLHTLDGSQLVNTRVPFGSPLPKTSPLAPERAAAGPSATVVSNLYFAPIGRQFSFALQVPVVRDGRPIYLLSIGGFASALQSVLQDQRVADGWVASILDANGVVVARNIAAETFVGKRVSERLLSQLARGAEGSFESVSIDGIPIHATFSKAPNYGWAVVVGVPLSAMSAPLRVVAAFAALAALLLACALLAAIFIARRLIRPVRQLQAASEAVGSGRALETAPTGLLETDRVLDGLQAADERIREANRALEARRAEAEASAQALRQSNDRLQLATHTSGLGLFTWRPLRDLVEWHNDLPYKILGIAPGELPVTGARFMAEFVHPDDAVRLGASVRQTLEEGAPFGFLGRIHRRDGELRWVEFTGRAQQDGGRETVVVGAAADVTERIAAETALRQSEERLRQLANTIPNLAWIADASGDITWFNDRWYDYTGSTPDEMKGWGWQRVHRPDTLPEVVRQWRESLRTGHAFEMTFPLRGKGGVFRPFFTRVAPLRDTSGAIVQWFGTNTDVSSLKEAEEGLREADRRKDEYLAMLAHELRNPLAPIRTAAALLKRIQSNEPRIARASEIIARQVGHMSGLLDDLLDVSRITRGLMTIERERVNVASTVASALEQVRPLMEAKRHHVEFQQEEPHLEVMGSSLRLTQVVANLLDNAAKYSAPRSRIEVAVRRSEGEVRIEVTDTGQGIPAELLARVFEPFTQGERGSHRSEGGLGLGLAVVRGLVELQGGSVSAHSAGLSGGSRFVVELPEAPPASQVMPGTVDAPAASAAPAALDLLVVDDNRDAADSVAELLQFGGHRVQRAYTARHALDLMQGTSFDAAILDIGLPDMSGYALARAIRTGGLRVGTLIALSGYGQDTDRESSAAAGFAHHLVKPVDEELLLRVLSTTARQSARVDEAG